MNSIVGTRDASRLPYGKDLEIKAAIAAVLASLTATLTSVAILVVLMLWYMRLRPGGPSATQQNEGPTTVELP